MTNRFLRPSAWPINGKLAFAFLISALIPIALTAFFGYRDTLDNVRQSQMRQLERLAETTARRIDLLVTHSTRVVRGLQRNQDVLALLAGKVTDSSRVAALLKDVLSSNEDVQEVILLNAQGVVVVSSSPARMASGQRETLGPLPIKPAAAAPRGITAGITMYGDAVPALLVAGAMTDAAGVTTGHIVLKLVPGAIDALLAESTLRGRAVPFVIDDLGVILQHPDAKLEGSSLGPLAPADLVRARAERRYGLDPANIRSLGADALAARVRTGSAAGHVEHPPLFSSSVEATGFAPVLSLPWMVGVTEPRTRWEAPLRDVYLNVIAKVLMVAALAALAGVAIFARDLVQPVRRLIASAQAVRAGDYAKARAESVNEDEIGELTQTFNSMVDSIEKRDRERDLFGRMVSPEVREKMLAGQLKMGGENREVVVLFSDIRDFTTLCEGMRAEQVVEMLNEYLTEMTAAVKEWDGYVNNFMGDAIMVVFGAPFEHPDSAWAAVQAAFGMRERLQALNRRRQARGEAAIGHGIGIARGTVVAGQMGSLERFQYTVIGDAVNVASRLEALTKEYPENPILVTVDIVEAIRHHQWAVSATPFGERMLKGRSQATELYSLARA
ncbi:MAG: adenylate/guanylate cyclase domain-containing protein [Burkholderiales bacterium]|nr:adenylate/guanylate cyclase domain-containing protein [Burkholderiales bacterium]